MSELPISNDLARAAPPPNGSLYWRQLLPLLAVVAFSIVLRIRIASIPLERDEGGYAYIATRWLAGDVPYRDAFDQKPPGTYLAYASAFVLGAKSKEAIHWLGHLWLVGAAVFVYLIGRQFLSSLVGVLAALCLFVLVMDASVLGNASNTEVFAILPMSAATFFSLRAGENGRWRDGVLAGVCAGLSLVFKQVSAPVVAFQAGWILWRQLRLRRIAADGASSTTAIGGAASVARPASSLVAIIAGFAAGAAIVLALPCAYFAAKGAWQPFYDCVVGHNLAYSSRIPLSGYAINLQYGFNNIFAAQWPIVLAAVVGVLALLRSRSPAVAACIAWWVTSLAAVSVGGFFREHYFILLMPPSSLIAACGVEFLARCLESKRADWQLRIAAAIGVLVVAWPIYYHLDYFLARSPDVIARRLYHFNPFVESEAVAKLLREKSSESDRIFIYGSEPQIFFQAGRVSASRYMYLYPLFGRDPESADRQRAVLAELERERPKFLIIVRVPTSFVADPNAPQLLARELPKITDESYELFAYVIVVTDGTYRIVPVEPGKKELALAPGSIAANEEVSLVIWVREN